MSGDDAIQGLQPLGPASEALTARSSAMVRRALKDAVRLDAIAKQVGDLIVPFLNENYDARAAAAKAIVDLAPNLTVRDPHVTQLVFQLVFDLHYLFERGQAWRPPWGEGQEYYPPDQRYERLLRRALDSLVGPISDLDDGLLRVFSAGDADAKREAAWWLGERHVYRATTVLQDALSTATDEQLSFVLRYALCTLGAADADAFSLELAQDTIQASGNTAAPPHFSTITYLAHDVSADTLGQLIALLDTDDDQRNTDRAIQLLKYSCGEAPDGTWGLFRPDARHPKALQYCSTPLLNRMMERVWLRLLQAVYRRPPRWRLESFISRGLGEFVQGLEGAVAEHTGAPLWKLDGGLSRLLLTLLDERERRSLTENRA